jgi:hypothetical protein
LVASGQWEQRDGVSLLEFLWPEFPAYVVLGAVFLAAAGLLLRARRVYSGWTCLFGAVTSVDLIWRNTGAVAAAAVLVLLFAALCHRPLRWLAGQSNWWPLAALLLFGGLAAREVREVATKASWPRVLQLDRWSTDDRLYVTRGGFALRGYRRLRATDWAGPWRFEWAQGSGSHRARLILEGAGRETKFEVVTGEGSVVALGENRVGIDLLFGPKGGAADLKPLAPDRPLQVLAVADLEGQLGGLAERLRRKESRPDVVILLGNMVGADAPLDVFELRMILDAAGVIVMAIPGPAESGTASGDLYDALLAGKRPHKSFSQYGKLRAFRLDQTAGLRASEVQALTLPGPFALQVEPCLIAANGPFREAEAESPVGCGAIETALRAELTVVAAGGLKPGPVDGRRVPLIRVGALPTGEGGRSEVLAAEFTWPLTNGLSSVEFSRMERKPTGLLSRAEATGALLGEQAAAANLLPVALGGVLASLLALTMRTRSGSKS